jgi:membrane protease YdiL (CAAX protease family)
MHQQEMVIHKPQSAVRTWIAVLFALFAILPIRLVMKQLYPQPSVAGDTLREALILACAAGLLLYIHFAEKLPLSSVGIGTSVWWKSILWGVVTAAVCLGAAGGIIAITKWDGGAHSHDFDKFPLWLITLIVFRAGFVEELFYRGFAIERLSSLGWPRAAAALVPLVIFALLHYPGGPMNIVVAFTLGAILTGFYLWRRDLVANIIAHFLVDFIANVIPRLAK